MKSRLKKVNPIDTVLGNIKQIEISKKDKETLSDLVKTLYEYREISPRAYGTRQRYFIDTNVAIASCVRSNLCLPFKSIGDMFKKHHATIIYYCKIHKNLYDYDNNYKELYDMGEDVIKKHDAKYNALEPDEELLSESIGFKEKDKLELLENKNRILRINLSRANTKIDDLTLQVQNLSKISKW